jgi:hypothetical protein
MPDMICETRGGEAAAAKTIERNAARPDIVAGIERGHAPHIAALLAHLCARAPDDVVHLRGIELIALPQRFEDGGRQVLRVHIRKGAFSDLADASGRADGVDDVSFGHWILLGLCES